MEKPKVIITETSTSHSCEYLDGREQKDNSQETKTSRPQNLPTTSTQTISTTVVRARKDESPSRFARTEMQVGYSTQPAGNTEYAFTDQSVTLLQTPEQEQIYRRLVIVADSDKSRKKTFAGNGAHSPSSEEICFTVPRHKEEFTEYKELNSDTMDKFYGDVTPFGTVAKSCNRKSKEGIEFLDGPMVSDDFNSNSLRPDTPLIKSGTSTMDRSRISSPLYSTLLRTTSAGPSPVPMTNSSIDYIDFLPKMTKETCFRREYEDFPICIENANAWLAENQTYNVLRCESVRHRLDHAHQLNPEATTSDDRSYVIGLRLWLKRQMSKESVTKLGYQNIIPRYKNQKEGMKWKKGDFPYFEDLPQTMERLNQRLQNDPLSGTLLNVETIPINYALAHRDHGSLHVDITYCSVDLQGTWEFHVVRLYYIEHESLQDSPDIGFVDFAPSLLTLPPSQLQFESHSGLMIKASNWMKSERFKKIIGLHTVEYTFKKKSLLASKGHLNTNLTCFETARVSAGRDTLRVLRLWYVCNGSANDGRKSIELGLFGDDTKQEIDMVTFTPCQLTTSWCCGAQRAIYATTRHTVTRVNEWLSDTGAQILSVQTDNVEKWQKSSFSIHTILPARTYNKEDHAPTMCRSSLECRLVVLRVYFRPNAFTNTVEPPAGKPAQPLCCFVGCNIM